MRHWVLIAFGSAVFLGSFLWVVRNLLSDQFAYWDAEQKGTERAYQLYVDEGWLHVKAAREKLPFAALADARKARTVTAFRNLLTKYPNSPVEAEARSELHAFYEKSLAAFRQQAPPDPRLQSFMGNLLGYLEKSNLQAFEVSFVRPNASLLRSADQRLEARATNLGGRFEPVAPHFAEQSALTREQLIVNQLARGFAAVFPADVLQLSMGATLPSPRDAPADRPLLVIVYAVVPSGDFYQSERQSNLDFMGPRVFVGIQVVFDVSMRFPGEAQPLTFNLSVAPPERFNVRYTQYGVMDSGPSAGDVYTVMAERAFDQLGEKLRGVFFSKDSQAFRSAGGQQ
jgi:hypothetical protein